MSKRVSLDKSQLIDHTGAKKLEITEILNANTKNGNLYSMGVENVLNILIFEIK